MKTSKPNKARHDRKCKHLLDLRRFAAPARAGGVKFHKDERVDSTLNKNIVLVMAIVAGVVGIASVIGGSGYQLAYMFGLSFLFFSLFIRQLPNQGVARFSPVFLWLGVSIIAVHGVAYVSTI